MYHFKMKHDKLMINEKCEMINIFAFSIFPYYFNNN